jgi:two-component system cell cycle response regulator
MTGRLPKRPSMGSPSQPSGLVPLADRTGYMQMLRGALCLVALAAGAFAPRVVGISMGEVARATIPYLFASLALEKIRRAGKGRGLMLIGASLLIDGLFLAWLTYLTGGTESPFRFLIYLHLMAVTLLASYRTGLKVALWHSLLFFVVFYAQGAGFLEPTEATSAALTDGASRIREASVFNVMVFWLVALGTAFFSSLNERELRRRRADMEALAAMAAELDETTDRGEIARIVLKTVREAFGLEPGIVLGVRGGSRSQLVRLDRDGPIDDGVGIDAVVKRAWDTREVVLVKELSPTSDPQLATLLPRSKNVVVVPLIAEGHPLGVLAVQNSSRIRSTIELRVVTVLAQLASHAALALRNARLLQEVRQMAETDPLTSLANRRTFDKALQKELSRARRRGDQVSLVMVDIDHFKAFNDAHGHQAGDELLKDVAQALTRAARDFDVVARYGGEEFAIILPSCSWEDSLAAAERLRKAVSKAKSHAAVTASAGVATFPAHASDGAALIRSADIALYESKKAGRDRVTRWEPPGGPRKKPVSETPRREEPNAEPAPHPIPLRRVRSKKRA